MTDSNAVIPAEWIKNMWKCPNCGKRFIDRAEFDDHITSHFK